MGGLSAAALLAKAGKKVLVVEKESRVGGHIRGLEHAGYHFDNAARLIMGCNADGPYGPGVIHSFLEQLGVRDQCEFIPVQPFLTMRRPGLDFQFSTGKQAFIDGLRTASPTGWERLPELVDLYCSIYHSGTLFGSADRPWGLLKIPAHLAKLLRNHRSTLEDVLAEYLPDQRARTIAGSFWPYVGLAPQQASFVMVAVLIGAYIAEGAYYCKGGLSRLAEATALAFRQQGGELRTGCGAAHLLVKDRRVSGVKLADGQRVFAPLVIANIDPRTVFGEMIEPVQSSKSYRNWLGRLELASSAVSVSLVTHLDLPALGYSFDTLVFDSWEQDQSERDPSNGKMGAFGLTITTLADPDLAPPGQHLVNICTALPAGYNLAEGELERFSDIMLAEAAQHIPELPGSLALARTIGAPKGYLSQGFCPMYGWASIPRLTLRRPGRRTPIRGL